MLFSYFVARFELSFLHAISLLFFFHNLKPPFLDRKLLFNAGPHSVDASCCYAQGCTSTRVSTRRIFPNTTCAQVDVAPAQRRSVGPPNALRSRHAPASLSGHRALGGCRVVQTQQGFSGFGAWLCHGWKRGLVHRVEARCI